MNEPGVCYPMTAAQNLLFLNQKYTVHKQVNNIFTLMLVEGKLDFDVLKTAIGLAYEHNDSLRIRLKKVGGAIRQFFTPPEPLDIKELDFTGQTRKDPYSKQPDVPLFSSPLDGWQHRHLFRRQPHRAGFLGHLHTCKIHYGFV
jgi:hypothetical protein